MVEADHRTPELMPFGHAAPEVFVTVPLEQPNEKSCHQCQPDKSHDGLQEAEGCHGAENRKPPR
jgi:hypothetical protein